MLLTKLKPGETPAPVVKTSVKLRRSLWIKARKLALGRGTDLAVIVNDALEAYLKGTR